MNRHERFLTKEAHQGLKRINAILAESVLIGSVTFEEAANRLMRAYNEVYSSIHGGAKE